MTNRIVVGPLTGGAVSNGYLNIRDHRDFFPTDAVGGPSVEAGEGVPIRCCFAGMEGWIETDIAGDKMILRNRGAVAQFFAHHGLHAGDQVAIRHGTGRDYFLAPG